MSNYDPEQGMLGGYTAIDGTIEFYGRVNALLDPRHTVLDLGAGRGAAYYEDKSSYRRQLRGLKGKVAEVVGADVDPVVLTNQTTDRNVLIENGRIAVDDNSVDLVISDYVIEHIVDVEAFRSEIERVLKPGGYFCARTPHRLNYVSFAARAVKNSRHSHVLKRVQPTRKAEDVFPTAYRCNSLAQVRAIFAGWENSSYIYTSEPRYYFGRHWVFCVLSLLHRLAPSALTGNLFIFLRKPA
jgi:SAM-dependent methyltransferase